MSISLSISLSILSIPPILSVLSILGILSVLSILSILSISPTYPSILSFYLVLLHIYLSPCSLDGAQPSTTVPNRRQTSATVCREYWERLEERYFWMLCSFATSWNAIFCGSPGTWWHSEVTASALKVVFGGMRNTFTWCLMTFMSRARSGNYFRRVVTVLHFFFQTALALLQEVTTQNCVAGAMHC